jgi:hypothetical protein
MHSLTLIPKVPISVPISPNLCILREKSLFRFELKSFRKKFSSTLGAMAGEMTVGVQVVLNICVPESHRYRTFADREFESGIAGDEECAVLGFRFRRYSREEKVKIVRLTDCR